jgi:mRNA-degrading endonuclease RelE of RelBE toxin-antitoxin system
MVFIETSFFTKNLKSYLSDEEFSALQIYLTEHPEAGAVIKGSGGARKVRWGAKGRGKSGGVRVIYYWITSDEQILLLTVYDKSERDDLSAAELTAIGEAIRGLK